eukprot:1145130-Pelagomonas_calceolata.AAC.3
MVLLACSAPNAAASFCLKFQSHLATSVPGVFGGRGHGVIIGCAWYPWSAVGSGLLWASCPKFVGSVWVPGAGPV